jgi:hypothetical protein
LCTRKLLPWHLKPCAVSLVLERFRRLALNVSWIAERLLRQCVLAVRWAHQTFRCTSFQARLFFVA